ncbi:hypothetical protein [Halomontanus rarus]|uniref:hypothetical protein n=1 Tax=Halomontanus rarus TaxID=3034020 RepID=UPI0023E8DEC5|nr:hypothetical protein [Halovivax sp. TS33]
MPSDGGFGGVNGGFGGLVVIWWCAIGLLEYLNAVRERVETVGNRVAIGFVPLA